MANTPNINLVKPLGTDKALVSVINDNSDKIDAFAGSANTNMANTQNGYAIVVDGNNAPKAITAGQYLFIKNHSTLSAGGYHATANIANGAAVTSSNVAADADGVVNGAFSALNSNLNNLQTSADTIVSNIEGVKTALTNFASAMNVGEAKLVRIVHTDSSDSSVMRPSVRYSGYLTKNENDGFCWLASGYLEKEPVIFSYYNGNQLWVAEKLALNSNISDIVTGTFTANSDKIGASGYRISVAKIGRIAYVEGYFQPKVAINNGDLIGTISLQNHEGMNHLFVACTSDSTEAYSLYIEQNTGNLKSNSNTPIPVKSGAKYITFTTMFFT